MSKSRFRSPASPIGAVLRRLRAARRMSQLHLATAAGVSTRHLSFVETGRATASRGLVLRLGVALGVTECERTALLEAAGYSARAASSAEICWHESIIDTSPMGIVAVDNSQTIVLVNQAQVELVGAPSRRTIEGKHLRDDQIWLVPEARHAIQRCLESSTPGGFEAWGRTRHGKPFHVRAFLAPFLGSNDQVLGGTAIVQPLPIRSEYANGIWAREIQ